MASAIATYVSEADQIGLTGSQKAAFIKERLDRGDYFKSKREAGAEELVFLGLGRSA